MENNKIQKREAGIALLPKELAQVIETGELFRIQQNLTPIQSYGFKKMSSFIQSNELDLFRSIELIVANMAMSVNVKYNITPDQAPDIARTIYKKYYFYSIEEIALVLRMGSEGELARTHEGKLMGKIYDRLSKDTIMEWFIIYDLYFREPIVNNKREELNRSYNDPVVNEVWNKFAGKILEDMENRTKEEEDKESNYKAWKETYFKQKKDEVDKQDNELSTDRGTEKG